MKIVDVNILLYAINCDSAHHARVRSWWEGAMSGDEPIGLAWVVLLGFLRMASNPHVMTNPLSPEESLDHVNVWLTHPNTRVVSETSEHWRILNELLSDAGTLGNLTTDAHLASLAIAHGATLVSCDADFGRFAKLRWENPVV